MASPEERALYAELPAHSLLSVSLRSADRLLGTLSLVRLGAPGAPYDGADLRLVQEVADRTGLAMENARLFAETQEAVRAREEVLAVVSHDLRSPLSAVTLGAELMLQRAGELSEDQARRVGRIRTAAARAQRLIRDLLDLAQARSQAGLAVSPVACDLGALAQQVVDELREAHPARTVELSLEGDTRGVWDLDRMAQVITNLVGNALQHGRTGAPVRLRVSGDDGQVRLEVHNEGEPIPAELRPRLFEPYRRGAGAGHCPGSMGLGLFITHALVRAHGGTVDVRSSAAAGTTFEVMLPRAPPA